MLSTIDLNKRLSREQYVEQLIRHQLMLRTLAYQLYVKRRPLVIVYEGWDAGGKGGNIKRLTEKLDPRGYEVYPIAAPTGEDKTHHYLWRFWRRLRPPDEKQILIFDRSWYGRVLVERLEGFCTEAEWKRAYREINEFERQLVDFGTIVVKFWIQISRDEQLRRFQERQETPYKAWKLTDEDWRNRAKWDLYEEAINDMLLKTSTMTAPWTIVEGNDKWYARVKALKTLVEVLSRELDYAPPDPLTRAKKKRGETVEEKRGKKEASKQQPERPKDTEMADKGKGKKGKKGKKDKKGKKGKQEKKEKKGKKAKKEQAQKKGGTPAAETGAAAQEDTA